MHYPELKELHINKFLTEVPEWFGEYHASDKEYHFAQRYGGHVLAFRNLDDPKRKKGTENAIIAVDELTEIPLETFTYLRGSLRWPRVESPKFISASNPDGEHANWVRQIFIEKRPIMPDDDIGQFSFVPAPFRDNPYLPQSYYDDIERIPEPLRSAWTKGDWYTDRIDRDWQVFPASHVRTAMERWRMLRAEGKIPEKIETIGADFADAGLDSSVFTPCARDVAIEQIVEKGNVKNAQDHLEHLLRTIGGIAHCDVIGVGAGAFRSLEEMGLQVVGVNFSAKSGLYDRSGQLPFGNLRAQYYWSTREALEPREDGSGFAIPDDQELYHDLTAVNWKMTSSGIMIEEKKKIKERLGRSPDKGDSLVLGIGGQSSGRLSLEWL